MKCPGQDMRFWKPGDIFETQCPKCGGKVEFFKDEVRRKCHCGHVIVNPKLDFGCAEWCQYAEQILKMEGGNPLVVLGAAYLHDIGIHEAENKFGSTSGHYQEMEGPAIAREILERLDIQKETIEEICDIIGHHHSPREEETLNFQILYEADWLVNIEEEGISKDRERLEKMVGKVFKTVTGRQLAEKLYPVRKPRHL